MKKNAGEWETPKFRVGGTRGWGVRGRNDNWKRKPWGLNCIRNAVFLKPTCVYMDDHCTDLCVAFMHLKYFTIFLRIFGNIDKITATCFSLDFRTILAYLKC